MFYGIGLVVLGGIVGGFMGALAVAIVASEKDRKVAMLAASNKRLLGDCVTAAMRIVELEREIAAANEERDNWRVEASKVVALPVCDMPVKGD